MSIRTKDYLQRLGALSVDWGHIKRTVAMSHGQLTALGDDGMRLSVGASCIDNLSICGIQ
jgi:hypothetical protein